MPKSLWSSARRILWRSKYAEARIAAIRCDGVSRRKLVRVCSMDRELPVRQEAWQRLVGLGLSTSAARILSYSKFKDIRLQVVESERLPRPRLCEICRLDRDEFVRRSAWNAMRGKLSGAEAAYLVCSTYADVRTRSVQSGKLSRHLLFEVGRKDKDRSARLAALGQITATPLIAQEALALSRFPDVQFRVCAAESGLLSPQSLAELCRADEEQAVRESAWKQLSPKLRYEEASALSYSKYQQVRLWAVESGLLSRWRLFILSLRDPSGVIRSAARKQRAARKKKGSN